jgi:hypothetical protein
LANTLALGASGETLGSSSLPLGTSKEKSNFVGSPRFARQPNCKEFWLKKSVGGFELVKEIFFKNY